MNGEFPSEAAENRRASGDVRLITGGRVVLVPRCRNKEKRRNRGGFTTY